MIRSDHLWAGRLSICLWINILFCTVAEGRRYDNCTTGDGREGLCVVKRICREASQHELLPCERDDEHHCCPIPTTQRSAPIPPSMFEGPLEEEKPRPETEIKKQNTDVSWEQNKNDQQNITPSHEGRRAPFIPDYDMPKNRPNIVDRTEPYDSERRNRNKHPENPGILIERPRHNHQRRPVARPNEYERRDHVTRQPARGHAARQPERDPVARQPERNTFIRDPTRDPDARQPERSTFIRDPVARQPDGNTFIRNPTRDPTDARHPERPIRLPTRDNNARQPNIDHDVRQPTRDHDVRQPTRDHDARQQNKDHVVRQQTRDHTVRQPEGNRYPPRDVVDPPRALSPPRWNYYPPERKNRTADDTSNIPITFPQPYEFSVPRQVPACGVKPYDLFIAGGQESAEKEWPWMTAIFRRYPDSRPKTFLCGGSLINTKYVLTAAHCFVNNYVILPASSFVVRLGSKFLDDGDEYTVANLVIHHNHSGSDFFNDIALVRIASEVYITDRVAPVCLPSPDMIHQSLVGRAATVAGWGDTAFRTSGTRILQHVTVPIVSGEECFAAYSRVRGAAFLARGSDHVICAGLREGGKDACLGDSGGPLMIRMPDERWIIVGIVSLGYKCAEPGYPGVYTRVTHYMSWINTNMKRY